MFSPDLSLNTHISAMIKKTNKLTGWVFRTFRSRSQKIMMTVWKSLLQPKLDYCSQLWSPSDERTINELESIQRNYLGRIYGLRDKDYWERLATVGLYSQQRRRERYAAISVWKCAVGLTSGYSLTFKMHPRRGRICTVRTIDRSAPASIRRISESSLAIKGAKIFNLLPRHIRDIDALKTDPFKRKLDSYLSNIPDQPTISERRRPAVTNSLIDQIPMLVRTL